MERIDKFISNIWYGSRKDIKKYIKDWIIAVNWVIIQKAEHKINFWDIVSIWEEDIEFREFIYVMLNKPEGYVTSNIDEAHYKSFLSLLHDDCPYTPLLSSVWRLDVDTTGLIIATNDWNFIHQLISPKKDIFKKYLVKSEKEISQKDIENLEKWVKINKDSIPYTTKPSKVEKINEKEFYIYISEWKFHQIKKMLESIDNKVIELKRIAIWSLNLDKNLDKWQWRYLTKKEVDDLIKN